MRRGAARVMKGVGTGIAVGMVVGTVGTALLKGNKGAKKKASRAIRAVGDVIDNVQYMMR